MKTRIYGSERTHLTLSEKAELLYSNTDPLTIAEIETDGGYVYEITGCIDCDGVMTEEEVNEFLESLYDEDEEDEDIVLEIGKIDIKVETFCTAWNGNLYCVDICEDAEERSAWLYNSRYGVKSLMFGYLVNAQSREEFLDLVFSNLPDYIVDYAEEFED